MRHQPPLCSGQIQPVFFVAAYPSHQCPNRRRLQHFDVASQRLTWALNDRSTFKQEIVANISAEDSDNFTLVASAQLDTALTPDLYWMIGLEYLFDNQPARGQGEEDLSLNTGVTIRF